MLMTTEKTAGLLAKSANLPNTVEKSIMFGGEMKAHPKLERAGAGRPLHLVFVRVVPEASCIVKNENQVDCHS